MSNFLLLVTSVIVLACYAACRSGELKQASKGV